MDKRITFPFFMKLEEDIAKHLENSKSRFEKWLCEDSTCLVIKYLPPARLSGFLNSRNKLYASSVPGYTWGDGVYVAPLSLPLTTMMYGRVGIVGLIEPKVVYDATNRWGIRLYQKWIRYQWPWYNRLTTTMHADHANRVLRNAFRTRFQIDCIVFRPDQECPSFVDPHRDYWFALTHWVKPFRSPEVGSGYADCVKDARWCIVCTEEFLRTEDPQYFKNCLGPEFRKFGITNVTPVPHSSVNASKITASYLNRLKNPNEPLLCFHE